jgi:hypothetical protein
LLGEEEEKKVKKVRNSWRGKGRPGRW